VSVRAAGDHLAARLVAPTFRTDLREIGREGDHAQALSVGRLAMGGGRHALHDCARLLQPTQHTRPQLAAFARPRVAQYVRIADGNEAIPGAREQHVDPLRPGEKSDLVVGVGAHQRGDDDLGLLALVIIDGRHTD
jgi:hypothetical protein